MREVLERVVVAGTKTPSGDNCQPWRFRIAGNAIDVYLLPERDTSLYSWEQSPSFIAHGALLENMRITAGALGYRADIEPLPDSRNPYHTAHITLHTAKRTDTELADAIDLRCTNRKTYRDVPLTDTQRTGLVSACGDSAQLIEDALMRKALGTAVASNERVLFENKQMHSFFFRHMLWTAADAAARPIGFPVGALELPPPVRAVWPAFRHWPIMTALTSIGFARGIALGNAAIYASGSAMVCFRIKTRSAHEFLRIGGVLQRVWLTATHLGLQAQILTGIPLLMNRIVAGDTSLSLVHMQLVRAQYEQIERVAGNGEIVAFLLRIGESDSPSSRTPRLPASIS